MSTTKKIRLIIIDNSEEDGLLILKRVEKLGYRIEHRLCTTKAELIDALKSGSWDLVISEYEMSGFDGRTALRLVSEITPDTPFILIAGPIGEELTVEMMNNGVSDYLLKDNLENLESVIERALNQSGLKTNEEIAGNNSDTVLQIIDKSLNEIYIFDAETFRITYANGAAIKNLGYSRDALLSRNYQSIALGCNKEKLRDILKPLEDSESDQVRLSVIHKRIDGRSYPMQMCFQLFSHHGSSCYSAIGFNLSDVMEGSKKLYEQKRLAEEYERISDYKSQFLANISHELRTPLNSILLITRLLIDKKSENLDAYQKKHISVIQDSAEGLLEMVNEILDLSKIEAGRMEVRVSETDIRSSVRKIEDLFAHVAASKGVELNVDVNNNVPQLVFTDRIKVEQILRNLLSNACKFTEEGYVSLTVEITESESNQFKKEEAQKFVTFRVEDTGIGIPPDKHDEVFEVFRQAYSSTDDFFGGTGLGLAICKQLAHLLQGEISLESSPGQGSIFTLALPLQDTGIEDHKSAGETGIVSSKEPAPKSEVNHELLIIDDSQYHSEVIAELLSDHVSTCHLASSGTEARELLKAHDVSMILLDFTLPDEDGLGFLKKLKSNKSYASIPVIVYSGKSLPANELNDLLRYAEEFILKNVGSYQKVKEAVKRTTAESHTKAP